VVVAQLSLPYRIALLSMLAVSALWFTVLKPTTPAPEPATTAAEPAGVAKPVAAAKSAAAASDASAAATQRATGGTESGAKTAGTGSGHAAASGAKAREKGGAHAAASGAKELPAGAASAGQATAKAKPAKAAKAVGTADRSAPLLRELDRKRAVVLLFYSARGIDDRAVRRAVADVDRRGGRVVVKAVPVGRLGRYQAITRGAQVLQAPTTLVIAPGRTAKPVVGFTTTAELDQAVADALAGKPAQK
jgi:hypothetical protein